MAEIIPIDPKWDHLTQEAVRATNMGMTYGKYKAMQYECAKRGLNALPEQPEAEPEPAEKVKPRRKLAGKEAKILAMLDEGLPVCVIAKRLHVKSATVREQCRIAGGELWTKYQQTARANCRLGRKRKARHD